MEIRFLGHAAFELRDGDTTVLIDPFLTGNPKAAVAAQELSPDAILLTHGHADHLGDTVSIAKRSGAEVVSIVEIANELTADGVQNVATPTSAEPWSAIGAGCGWCPPGTPPPHPRAPSTSPPAWWWALAARSIYHLGDTALFSDLQLVGRRQPIDVALMCIGGHYTMDRFDAVEAARLVGAEQVIPCHYDTFPPIATDAQAFKADVEAGGASRVVVLAPGSRTHHDHTALPAGESHTRHDHRPARRR